MILVGNKAVEEVEKDWSSGSTASYQNLIENIPRRIEVITEARRNTLSIDMTSLNLEI